MSEQLDFSRIKKKHDNNGVTLAERHRDVIINLRKIAEDSQAELKKILDRGISDGTVSRYNSYWIANVIEAELTANAIMDIAQREDVLTVYPELEIKLIDPVDKRPSIPPLIANVEPGLRVIGADSMWQLGYTGAGMIVCNFDTGVDGSHPALSHSWRGANGYPPEQCWYDPLYPGSNFPYDPYGHGTKTMGIMCGRSQLTPDTIGVAIDAQWIASSMWGEPSVFGAFQWAVDPDGNPYTLYDVPAVISNSWGSSGCHQVLYNLIDNCEAAGVAVIFAAGNLGPASQTVLTPGNRVDTQNDCFSTGAIDGNDSSYSIAGFSSRGPSPCDGQTVKPDFVAPGVSVRTSVPGGGYENGTGTSMATPYAAGAMALLRQVNPNASVDTIKWALMHSAQDLGSPGPDNDYGWGLINLPAAMALLPPVEYPDIISGRIRIIEPYNNNPDPGDTIEIFIQLRNRGLSAENVHAIVSSADQHVEMLQDSVFYGTIPRGDSVNPVDPFVVYIEQDTPSGWSVEFDIHIYSDSGYSEVRQLRFIIGTIAEYDIADHNIESVTFTISNFGQYGLAPSAINTVWNGRGFRFPNYAANHLYEGALLIGNGPERVSNGAHNEYEIPGDDFYPAGPIRHYQPGPIGDQEFETRYNDLGAENPLGIEITQRSFSFSSAPDNQYVIMRYTITNIGYDPLDNILIAHFDNWDISGVNSPNDMINFDRVRNLGYQYRYPIYRGEQVLSESGTYSFIALRDSDQISLPHFTLADKWEYMNSGLSDTTFEYPTDCAMMITTGPYSISPGDSIVAAFAIHGAGLLTQLQSSADAAINRYSAMTNIEENRSLPAKFRLYRNYPNPFNSFTTIEYGLREAGQVRIDIYDLLGRKVKTLIDKEMQAGQHKVVWDASGYSSGVYFYRIEAGDYVDTKRMVYLK